MLLINNDLGLQNSQKPLTGVTSTDKQGNCKQLQHLILHLTPNLTGGSGINLKKAGRRYQVSIIELWLKGL